MQTLPAAAYMCDRTKLQRAWRQAVDIALPEREGDALQAHARDTPLARQPGRVRQQRAPVRRQPPRAGVADLRRRGLSFSKLQASVSHLRVQCKLVGPAPWPASRSKHVCSGPGHAGRHPKSTWHVPKACRQLAGLVLDASKAARLLLWCNKAGRFLGAQEAHLRVGGEQVLKATRVRFGRLRFIVQTARFRQGAQVLVVLGEN